MDLHKTEEYLEADLDPGSWEKGDFAKGGGPFQVPFEIFIPEKVDGLLFAEKNIAQSRLVNGATRLQPITMLTGQAAGALAALAAKENVQPRALNPMHVQFALLKAGSTLVPRWYVDVPWGTQAWRASQFLSLYGILDRSAPIHKRNGPLREKWTWGANEPVTTGDAKAAIAKIAELTKADAPAALSGDAGANVTREQLSKLLGMSSVWSSALQNAKFTNDQSITRHEFAAVCVEVLTKGAGK